jgi:hypothetical protein
MGEGEGQLLAIKSPSGLPQPRALKSRDLVIVFAFLVLMAGCATNRPRSNSSGQTNTTPEARALSYLAREVPNWSKENRCYSCHNNGDAARALYTASRLSYPVPKKALKETSAWLSKPGQWDHNKGDPGFSDKRLVRIQFAAALATAIEAGYVTDRRALTQAARLVAEYQEEDGSWRVGLTEAIGSPAAYGTSLATYMAMQTLHAAQAKDLLEKARRAESWLQEIPVKNILDAAVVLLVLGKDVDAVARAKRQECVNLIRQGQSSNGGWGPYLTSPPEPFDTAVVLLALAGLSKEAETIDMMRRGRGFLLEMQQTDGGWPATTRPAGLESYAQHISTTGWATLALLATDRKNREPLRN